MMAPVPARLTAAANMTTTSISLVSQAANPVALVLAALSLLTIVLTLPPCHGTPATATSAQPSWVIWIIVTNLQFFTNAII